MTGIIEDEEENSSVNSSVSDKTPDTRKHTSNKHMEKGISKVSEDAVDKSTEKIYDNKT